MRLYFKNEQASNDAKSPHNEGEIALRIPKHAVIRIDGIAYLMDWLMGFRTFVKSASGKAVVSQLFA